jgi:hypothetical protein
LLFALITKPLMPSTSTHASGEDVMTGSLPGAADTAGETVKRLKNPARAMKKLQKIRMRRF